VQCLDIHSEKYQVSKKKSDVIEKLSKPTFVGEADMLKYALVFTKNEIAKSGISYCFFVLKLLKIYLSFRVKFISEKIMKMVDKHINFYCRGICQSYFKSFLVSTADICSQEYILATLFKPNNTDGFINHL